MYNAVEVGLLFRVLQQRRYRNISQIVRVELQETELETERCQILKVYLMLYCLGLHALILATLGHPVVARVEEEAGQRILDQVFRDVDAGLQMLELVVTGVPLEYLGRNAFVCSQEP